MRKIKAKIKKKDEEKVQSVERKRKWGNNVVKVERRQTEDERAKKEEDERVKDEEDETEMKVKVREK